jgi:hypothetical protein
MQGLHCTSKSWFAYLDLSPAVHAHALLLQLRMLVLPFVDAAPSVL